VLEFYQLFDEVSSTFTYLLIDAATREAVMIDPVSSHVDDYCALLKQEQVVLKFVLETHTHADHITGAGLLRERTGACAATPIGCGIDSDLQLQDGAAIHFGHHETVSALHTPGHTAGSMSYLWQHDNVARAFTGDALLIDSCGRADFQGGDAGALFDSITTKLFALPDHTVVCPGHDYHGRQTSTIGHERAHNARLAGRSRAAFIELMENLQLPVPSMMAVAVPANRQLGLPLHGV